MKKNYMMETTYQAKAVGLNKPYKYTVFTQRHKYIPNCPAFAARFENEKDALGYCNEAKKEWEIVRMEKQEKAQ